MFYPCALRHLPLQLEALIFFPAYLTLSAMRCNTLQRNSPLAQITDRQRSVLHLQTNCFHAANVKHHLAEKHGTLRATHRSEERRVGKESRSRCAPYHCK